MKLYPLTESQQSIWNTEQYFGGSTANITGSLMFDEPMSDKALNATLNYVMQSYNILRTRIKIQNGDPMQYINSFKRQKFGTARFDTKEDFDYWVGIIAQIPLDPNGDLYKIYSINVDGQAGLFFHLHRLIADARTLDLLGNIAMQYLKDKGVQINSHLDCLIGRFSED